MENIFINDEFKASTLPMASIDSVFSLFRTEGIFNQYKSKEDPLSRMAGTVDSLITSFKKLKFVFVSQPAFHKPRRLASFSSFRRAQKPSD
jgi:hypothetical protein